MTEASATRSPSIPRTRRCGSTTDSVVGAHAARACRVVQRLRERPDVGEELVVRARVVAREDLTVDERGERLLREHATREAKTSEQRCDVAPFRVGQVLRIDRRRDAGIRRSKENGARAHRREQYDREREPVLARRLQPLLLEQHGREEELEVGRGEIGRGANERDGLAEVRRQRPASRAAPSARDCGATRPTRASRRPSCARAGRSRGGRAGSRPRTGARARPRLQRPRARRAGRRRRAGAGAACRSHRRRGRPHAPRAPRPRRWDRRRLAR